jgi:hypothetical protein
MTIASESPLPRPNIDLVDEADSGDHASTLLSSRECWPRLIVVTRWTMGECVTASEWQSDMTDPDPAISDLRLRALYAYWQRKKGERLAPARADIAPEEITELLPWVFLIEMDGERFRFRLVGTAVTEEYRGKLTGMYLDEVDLDHATTRTISEYRKSARNCLPIVSQWQYIKNDGRYLDYERLILPLSADGKTVNMFLCGAVGHGVG